MQGGGAGTGRTGLRLRSVDYQGRCRRFRRRCRGVAGLVGPRRPSSRRIIRRYRVLEAPCSRGPSAVRGGPQDPRRRARSCVRPAPRGLPRWRLVCEETAWPWPAFAAHLFQLQAPRGGSRVLCRPDRSGPGAAGRRAPAAVLRALRLLPRSCLSGPRCDPSAFSGIPSRAAPSRTPSPPSASYGTSPSASRKRCVASFSSSPWGISVTVFADLPVVKERSRVLAVLSASLSVFF